MSSIKPKAGIKKKLRETGKIEKRNDYLFLPLYFVIGLIPLILFYKKFVSNDAGYLYQDGLNAHLDLFTYYKMIFLLVFSAVSALLLLTYKKNIVFEKPLYIYLISMSAFAFFSLLSALSSDYKAVSFLGYLDRFEGFPALLSYALLMFTAMNLNIHEKPIKMLFSCLFVSALIIFIIGAFQYLGIDFSKSELFNSLVTPGYLKNQIGTIKSNFPTKTVFSTLYNPNYMGSYTAILVPMTFTFVILAKKVKYKLIAGGLLCLAILNWITCKSSAGIVAVAFSLIVVLILLRKKIFRNRKLAIAGALFIVICFIAGNVMTSGRITSKIVQTVSDNILMPVSKQQVKIDQKLVGLKDVMLNSSEATLVTDDGILKISLPGGQFVVKDEKNTELGYTLENDMALLKDSRFKQIKLELLPDESTINVYYNNYFLMNIIFTDNGLNSSTNRWLVYRDGRDIAAIGFEGNETLGTNRGYIWSRTLPLLKDTLLIGKGPDTFPLYFPQYDFLSKLKLYGKAGIFVDKPHNMYLQTAVNTGVVSLLAILIMFAAYFVSSIKIYFKEDFSSLLSIVGFACFAGFCGYTVAGLFNDSVVSVAPVFWILFGLGIGINAKLSKKNLHNKNI